MQPTTRVHHATSTRRIGSRTGQPASANLRALPPDRLGGRISYVMRQERREAGTYHRYPRAAAGTRHDTVGDRTHSGGISPATRRSRLCRPGRAVSAAPMIRHQSPRILASASRLGNSRAQLHGFGGEVARSTTSTSLPVL